MDDATVTAIFAGERRVFRLGLGEWMLLQAKHDIGPFALEYQFRSFQVKPDQMSDVIKYGLIGAGVSESVAFTLCEATIKAGAIMRYYELAHAIIAAFLGPADEEELPKKPVPQKRRTKQAQTAKSKFEK